MQPLYELQARVRTKSQSKRSNRVGSEARVAEILALRRGASMKWIFCAGLFRSGNSDASSVIRALVRPTDGWGCSAPHARMFATTAAAGAAGKLESILLARHGAPSILSGHVKNTLTKRAGRPRVHSQLSRVPRLMKSHKVSLET